MGLDCYIVHGNDRDKAFTSEDDDRIENVQLCGGLFSGNGFDGSFRGKVYEPLIQELSEGQHTWYIDQEDEDAYIYRPNYECVQARSSCHTKSTSRVGCLQQFQVVHFD